MTDFAIHPPVHLRADPDTAIRSLIEAAAIVRKHGGDQGDRRATSVLYRLESASTPEDAEEAGSAFRAWARAEGLLLVPPEDAARSR
ncbi:MAG: hypothetical protein JO237_14345 [Pseudolabrys sp.]|nr:hypothetical protein [Pseudolabrys sp.]